MSSDNTKATPLYERYAQQKSDIDFLNRAIELSGRAAKNISKGARKALPLANLAWNAIGNYWDKNNRLIDENRDFGGHRLENYNGPNMLGTAFSPIRNTAIGLKKLALTGDAPSYIFDSLSPTMWANKAIGGVSEFDRAERLRESITPLDLADPIAIGGVFSKNIAKALAKNASKSKYYRFTNKEDPISDFGHAMFVDDAGREAVSTGLYGKHEWVFDEDAPHISELFDEIETRWRTNPPQGFEDIDPTDAKKMFNPSEIVNSAEAWDDGELLTWFWEHIGDPNDLKAVVTDNGAIVFDPKLIKRVK